MEWSRRWVTFDATKHQLHVFKQKDDSKAESTLDINKVSLIPESQLEFQLRSLETRWLEPLNAHLFRSTEAIEEWIRTIESSILKRKYTFIGFEIL